MGHTVEVLSRLEAENAPEDVLDDLWLAELSRLLGEGVHGTRSGGKQRDLDSAQPSRAVPEGAPSPEQETPLVALGDFLFC